MLDMVQSHNSNLYFGKSFFNSVSISVSSELEASKYLKKYENIMNNKNKMDQLSSQNTLIVHM